jgi:RTX calcium-binding nonapeptide repeat (4 copies)
MRRLASAVLPIALLACAVPAAGARAATVAADYSGGEFDTAIEIRDGSGERNDLRVGPAGSGVRVEERGPHALEARGGCERAGAKVVTCRHVPDFLRLDLGGGRDRVHVFGGVSYGLVTAGGGPGDDAIEVRRGESSLRGGAGDDVLVGGSGADAIDGGPGQDRLRGRGGADVLTGDGRRPYDDRLVGGGGVDLASWDPLQAPVRVDLRKDRGGSAGEIDRLDSIDGVLGGRRDDVLIGDDRPNLLVGGTGADRISAGGGNDRIDPNVRSTYEAEGRLDGSVDEVDCGAGDDRVRHIAITRRDEGAAADPLPQSCERGPVRWATMPLARLRLGQERIYVKVTCDADDSCRRRVTLRSADRVLGRAREGTEEFYRGETRRFTVPLAEPLHPGAPIDVHILGFDRRDTGSHWNAMSVRYRLLRPAR